MTSRDFAFWLQGFFELQSAGRPSGMTQPMGLSPEQSETIRRHLSLVFKHEIDPSFPAEQQAALNHIHSDNSPFVQRPENLPPDVLVRC